MPDNVCKICGAKEFTALEPISHFVCDTCHNIEAWQNEEALEYERNRNQGEWWE